MRLPIGRLTCGVIAIAALALAVASPALAKPGELDHGFGKDGRVDLTMPKEGEVPDPSVHMDVASAPGGKVVTASSRRVVELLRNGRVRRSFGSNGRVMIGVPDGWRFLLAAVAVDSRGRVLVAGTTESLSGPTQGPSGFPGPPQALGTVYRYLPNGKADRTFGEGGRVASEFGQAPPDGPGPAGPYPYIKISNEYPYATPSVKVTGMAVDAEDRPVVLGTSTSRVTACGKAVHSLFYLDRTYVARLNDEGEPDASFGSGGVVTELAAEYARTLALGPRGQIAYTSVLGNGCDEYPPLDEAQLVILDRNGAPELRLPIEHAPDQLLDLRAATFDRRGRILLLIVRREWEAAGIAAATTILRLRPDGSKDPGFGKRGEASPHLAQRSQFDDLAVDRRGRVLLAGTSAGKDGGRGSFLLMRLSAGGRPEPRFGKGDGTRTRFPGSVETASVLVDEAGGILAGGPISSPRLSTGIGFAVARYLGR